MLVHALLTSLLLAANAGAAAPALRPAGLPALEYGLHLHHQIGAVAATLSVSHDGAFPAAMLSPAPTPAAEAARLVALNSVADPSFQVPVSGWEPDVDVAVRERVKALRAALDALPRRKAAALASEAMALLEGRAWKETVGGRWTGDILLPEAATPMDEALAKKNFQERGYAVFSTPELARLDGALIKSRTPREITRESAQYEERSLRELPPELAPFKTTLQAETERVRRFLPGTTFYRAYVEKEIDRPRFPGFHEDSSASDVRIVTALQPSGESPRPGTLIADSGRLLQVPPGSSVLLTTVGLAKKIEDALPTLHSAPDFWDGVRHVLIVDFLKK